MTKLLSNTNEQALLRQKQMDCLYKCFSSTQWYDNLQKPAVTPPKWVFFVVWTILYVMMGVSIYFYIKQNGWTFSLGFLFFWIQLGLNFLWAPMFFMAKMITFALIELIVLWICILLTIIFFHQNSPISSYLLIPYLIWVTAAGYLNAYVVMNNQDPFFVKVSYQNKQDNIQQ